MQTTSKVSRIRDDVWGAKGLGKSQTGTSEFPVFPHEKSVVVSVDIGLDEDVSVTLRRIADVLEPVVLPGLPMSHRHSAWFAGLAWATSRGRSTPLEADQWMKWLDVATVMPARLRWRADHAAERQEDLAVTQSDSKLFRQEPAHQRLSSELREITGLPAATLGRALGVTREQYQRWLKGSPISSVRHGQLIYLHTLAAELQRKLGAEAARLWWRTPAPSGITPETTLRNRMVDQLHGRIAAISEASPVQDGVYVALPHQEPTLPPEASEEDYEGDDATEPWSPYGTSGPGRISG